MKATKRGLALILASLQVALSWGYPAYAAASQVVVQQVQTAVPVQTGPAAPIGRMQLGGPPPPPIAAPNAPVSLTAVQVQLSAPAKAITPSADGGAGPIDIQKTSARVSESLALPGLSRKAPAESSR